MPCITVYITFLTSLMTRSVNFLVNAEELYIRKFYTDAARQANCARPAISLRCLRERLSGRQCLRILLLRDRNPNSWITTKRRRPTELTDSLFAIADRRRFQSSIGVRRIYACRSRGFLCRCIAGLILVGLSAR